MTQIYTLINDPWDRSTWEIDATEDIRDVLVDHWPGGAPVGLKIWHMQIAESCDVSPEDQADWEFLAKLPGPFYITVEMHDPLTILIISIAVAVLTTVLTFLLRPALPTPPKANDQSSTNALADRQNTARPLQRIEDIAGEVRATFTLIGFPYKVFESFQEVEYAPMCVGRGYHTIADVREDQTLVENVSGQSVEFYAPFTSPLNGDEPQLRIGNPITEPLVTIKPISSVNGQTLTPPNFHRVTGDSNIFFHLVGSEGWLCCSDRSIDWAHYFAVGDVVEVSDATYDDGHGHVVDLAGTYTVLRFDNIAIFNFPCMVFANAAATNSDWTIVGSMDDDATAPISPTIAEGDVTEYIGYFTIDIPTISQLWFNFVAQGGLYALDSKNNPVNRTVVVRVAYQPLDENGSTIGPEVQIEYTLAGSTVQRSFLGWTFKVPTDLVGPHRVRARRISGFDYDFEGSIVDEIKWRDLYAVSAIPVTDFGNVTTVLARTPATPAALGIQARKLNAKVTRNIPAYLSDDTFTTELFPSRSAHEIFFFFALDAFNGRRTLDELNTAQIQNEVHLARAHFVNLEAIEFGYTFDDDKTSFEEMANAIMAAAFCQLSRRGKLIEAKFEGPTPDSSILFNHRNSWQQVRQSRFGNDSDFDGIEYNWIDGENYDAPIVYRIPNDGSARTPKKIETQGVRNFTQAYWHAWREWNKIRYQHIAVQFIATQEAGTLAIIDRVLVANNTDARTQDGEVVSQDGLVLTLSQQFIPAVGKDYLIRLQIPNGTVDAIPILPLDLDSDGATYTVTLTDPPSAPLALDEDAQLRTLYWIVSTDDGSAQAFLISSKEPADRFTFNVSAVNYSDKYYQNDSDVPSDSLFDVSNIEIVDDQGNVIKVLPGSTPTTTS